MSDALDAPKTPILTGSVSVDQVQFSTAPEQVVSLLDEAWPDVIAHWLADHVANSPIAQSTAAFNHLVQVGLPALRQALLESI